ncbi:MAG: TerB family tellurite resistance protein [Burkholderiaceae bacterium]
MLKAIRDFFDQRLTPAGNDKHSIELATAALLVETLRADAEIAPAERTAALAAVRDKFGLSLEEAETLIDLAEQEVRQASDRFQFTSLINEQFSQEQKIRVIEMMWRVAYADAVLTGAEQQTVRKIAELLHVPHGDYIHAKMRAREATGLAPE